LAKSVQLRCEQFEDRVVPALFNVHSPYSFTALNNNGCVATADFNKDGIEDAVVTNFGTDYSSGAGNSITVLYGKSGGGFIPVTLNTGGTNPSFVAVGDINGDGYPDLVVANENGQNAGSFSVFKNDGAGNLTLSGTYSTDSRNPSWIGLAPVLGDGHLDVVVGSFGYGDPANNTVTGNNITIFQGNGDFTFGSSPATTLAPEIQFIPTALAIADFNGDGQLDIAAAVPGVPSDTGQPYPDGTVFVFPGTGSGGFGTPLQYDSGGVFPVNIQTADLNGDGKSDLIVANSGDPTSTTEFLNNSVGVLLNTSSAGSLSFGIPSSLTTNCHGTFAVAVSDFNLDGKQDIAAINYGGQAGPPNAFVSLYMGNGNGTFTPGSPGTYDLQAGVGGGQYLAVGDFDGNNTPDLIAVGAYNLVTLMYNTSTPPVSTTTTLGSNLNPSTSGASVTFTATVSATSGTPSGGTVTFYNSGVQMGSPVSLGANQQAVYSTSSLTVGTHHITATYSGASGFSGSTTASPLDEVVNGTPASSFSFTSVPTNAIAGMSFSFTIKALDSSGNTAAGYTGTVHFTSSDAQATVPLNYTFVTGDNGVHTFTNGAILKTAGNQTITATDTTTSSITGTSSAIAVSAAAASHLTVSAPPTATAGTAFSGTVTAFDPFNNVATTYSGTVHFTSSDGQAVLPANSTLSSGTGSFNFTLKTAGNQTVTATDTVTAPITGTSSSITVSAAAVSHFGITAPSTATAGTSFSATVTALDPYSNTVTGYSGTVHFTSTDGQAGLPANSTLTSGTGSFTFTLKTAGNQTLTATDTANGSITGTSGNITVSAIAATHLGVTAPSTAIVGSAFSVTVTALDPYGNTDTSYRGTVHFTSSDGSAGLPGNYPFTAGDNGVHTFTNAVTLNTTGNQTVTATDTTTGSITGTSGNITVSIATATHFSFSTPPTATAGSAFSFTVTALDQLGQVAGNYRGTVHFTSSDGQALVPSDYTFTAADSGVHTFTNGLTLETAGNQTVTATDTVTGSITGTSGNVTVSAAAATHVTVSAPGTTTAGAAFSVTVTALDPFNNTATSYRGTVHFTSSDGQALLPGDYPFIAGDNGVHTFTNAVTLKTAGIQTVTATDTSNGSITGTSSNITVSAAALSHLGISAPGTATAGTSFSATVTALDPFNNTVTGYTGTVHFTSSDGQAVLPPNSTLSSGTGSFTFTLKTAGNQTLTATDIANASLTGTSGNVTVSAAAATHLGVTAPSTTTAGTSFSVTVTALDPYDNTVTSYSGTVHLTSSDGQAVLPANSSLSSGTSSFNITLKTAGNQTVTATDTVTGSINGTSGTIIVSAGAATHFTVSVPGTATAGTSFSATVTALDAYSNTVTGYSGTVRFTSTDGQAVLPANSTLSSGTSSFSFTLKTAGNQTLTATDTANGSITGTSTTVTVSAAAATRLSVSAPSTTAAGTSFSAVVTALDPYNNTVTGYTGTVHFTSSDGQAVLPPNSTLTSGTGSFNFTLKTAGNQTLTATDLATGSITGTSSTITVSPGAANHFTVSVPATANAGTAFNATVTALDFYNNVVTSYGGTVHLSSSDGQAALPANYAFTAGDNGIHTFVSGVTLKTAGNQTVTATDLATGSITGTSSTITVNPGAATHFMVSVPGTAAAGVAFNVTLTALDFYNNVATSYGGTVHLTSTDGQAVLPPNYAYTALDNGVHTFTSGVTLKTVGSQMVTATDLGNGSITGTSSAITVSAGAATHFTVSVPGTATAGTAFSVTVTALDFFNNVATSYGGTVQLSSSDGQAVLAPNYAFTALDNGIHTFVSSITLKTAGNQTVTATDLANGSITGTSVAVAVHSGAASRFTVSVPGTATAGTAFSAMVMALDAYNNTATGYGGTVHLTSSDGQAALSADYTFAPGDNGVHAFASGVTLKTAGSQTVTATDLANASITGTSSTITVSPGAATHFFVSVPATATAGTAFSITVTALDQFNNTATGYSGMVHFTSSDAQASPPVNTTLTSGAVTTSAILKTAGNQTLTATDTGNNAITGTSATVAVNPAAATHFIITIPATVTAGSTITITVSAMDAFNNLATGYSGTVNFTSSDGQAVLPPSSTLNQGTRSFSIMLMTAGNPTITATDAAAGSITGTTNTLVLRPGTTTGTGGTSSSSGPTISVTVVRVKGRPMLKVFNGDGTHRFDFFPYNKRFRGRVNFAIGDVNGDGFPDIVVTSASGPVQKVMVFDGHAGGVIKGFSGAPRSTAGGLHVAAGDINGDGRAEVVIGAGPLLRVFNGNTGQQLFRAKPFKNRPIRVEVAVLNSTGVDDFLALTKNRSKMVAYDGHTFQVLPASAITVPLGQIMAMASP
jgi:hypothetical protein